MKSQDIRTLARAALGDAPAVTPAMVAVVVAGGASDKAARKHLAAALAERQTGQPVPLDRRGGSQPAAGRPVAAESFVALVATVERRAAKITARQLSPEQAAQLAQRLRAAAAELERVTEHKAASPAQQHADLLAAAHRLLIERGVNVNGHVPLSPLADDLAAAQRCTLQAARGVVAQAIRQARGALAKK